MRAADQLGSIVAVTNASGAASGSGFGINHYDQFGLPHSSNSGRFGLAGAARYRDPQRLRTGPPHPA